MKRLFGCSVSVLIACLLVTDVPAWRASAQRMELRSLASLYDVAAGAVRDTNGDGLADSVAARVIVPADAAVEDIQAAANIAGRLGFETTAQTLPVVLKASDVSQPASVGLPILVGRSRQLLGIAGRQRREGLHDQRLVQGRGPEG